MFISSLKNVHLDQDEIAKVTTVVLEFRLHFQPKIETKFCSDLLRLASTPSFVRSKVFPIPRPFSTEDFSAETRNHFTPWSGKSTRNGFVQPTLTSSSRFVDSLLTMFLSLLLCRHVTQSFRSIKFFLEFLPNQINY